MKHIVLQLLNETIKSDELFRGLDPSWIKNNCVVIEQVESQMFTQVPEQLAWGRFQADRSQDWANIIGYIKQNFLGSDNNVQLDLIVGADGTAIALPIMQTIQQICMNLGMLLAVKIIFLAEIRSSFYQDEQYFYDEIKQAAIDNENGQPKYHWNCVYLLIANNEQQEVLRSVLLPYLLQFNCSSNNQLIKAFGGQVRNMDITAIDQVPRELSIQAACSALNRTPKKDPFSLLLLNVNAKGLSSGEQLSMFQTELNALENISYPIPVDLLVQKQSPLGDVSTRDLFARFCFDNPQSNPAYYENAGVEALSRMPLIAKAVRKWEERVVREGCAAGDLVPLIDMLSTNSDFDLLLREYQKPEIMNTEKTLTAQDGYTDISIRKLEPYINILQQILDNVVFEARIKLIRARLPMLRNQLAQIQQHRQKAVDFALKDGRTKSIMELIDSWSRKISAKLFNESLHIDLPGPEDDPDKWIQQSAGKMLGRIVPPDLDEGRAELYHSGMRIIENMGALTGDVLLPPVLSGGRRLTDKWIVYDQIDLHRDCITSVEPVVIKLVEFELDLRDSIMLDHQMFMPPLTLPQVSSTLSSGQFSEDPEQDEETESLSDFHEEELEEFMGTLIWIWDNVQYVTARVEVYADTGLPEDKEKPVFTQSVRYRADDRYPIGAVGRLPSGVPLIFRIIYQDHGRDVEDITTEIRMKAPKTILEVSQIEVVEGKKFGLFGGKPYVRLKITPSGPFETRHIAVGSSSGHFYSASWERTEPEGSWLSELLPNMEDWRVVDRPGDLIEYQIIQ